MNVKLGIWIPIVGFLITFKFLFDRFNKSFILSFYISIIPILILISDIGDNSVTILNISYTILGIIPLSSVLFW